MLWWFQSRLVAGCVDDYFVYATFNESLSGAACTLVGPLYESISEGPFGLHQHESTVFRANLQIPYEVPMLNVVEATFC